MGTDRELSAPLGFRCWGNGVRRLHQLDLQKGQTLLILGIGGDVGVTSAQIGRVHGFNVIGTGSESKRRLVESLGATLISSTNLVTAAGQLGQGTDQVLSFVSRPGEGIVGGEKHRLDPGDTCCWSRSSG
ncbi:hypothetical protein [Arthrobacter roseus]|uniref:hypothetical protein n=1 Tax=Arthrobacter roseus TaxID=136274 RepID=UPI0019638CFA|nr:hypothetical protein [Arthrobacter roseus]MBM7847528.1 D-arabinose 1-dehydrogenase-like Zn-dependent alcohol dehydrogenase [Arthrobacter roseus]